jgi:hypothetical protein
MDGERSHLVSDKALMGTDVSRHRGWWVVWYITFNPSQSSFFILISNSLTVSLIPPSLFRVFHQTDIRLSAISKDLNT